MKTYVLFLILSLFYFDTGIAQNDLIPDVAFGTNGVVYSTYGESSLEFSCIQIQQAGKIVTYGPTNPNLYNDNVNNYKLAGYNADGTVDTAFGANGSVLLNSSFNGDLPRFPSKQQMKIQADGKIVLIQMTDINPHPSIAYYDIKIKRYNSNGTPDTAFGNGGEALVHYGDYEFALALAIQPDGKILVGGNNAASLLVFRLNANGTIDQNFANNGFYQGNYNFLGNSNDYVRTIKVQDDGKIILGGTQKLFTSGTDDICAMRLNSNGAPDTTFGTNGSFRYDFGQYATYVTMQLMDNNKLAFFSYRTTFSGITTARVIRVTANGQLDGAFGVGGVVTLSLNSLPFGSTYNMIDGIIDNDQKIVVSLMAFNGVGIPIISRFDATGTVDASFNQVGYSQIPTLANMISIQDDGKFLFGGTRLSRFEFGILQTADFEKVRFSVYPNPFDNYVNVDLDLNQQEMVSINLLDLSGRKISKPIDQQIFSGKQTLKLGMPELSKGIYFLQITAGKTKETIKIVK